ncbi:HI1506-related protein [Candidatus Vondammii sp. HM_W22]|uniref:HI1506-related protein n=1 Tax=Candidatus Vondammii sp. HM_W22 TaxID=2687299 RepID=UPI001F1451CD|nr:HI1506-related protein [Candidatus Vondammii sp. HM_W22]
MKKRVATKPTTTKRATGGFRITVKTDGFRRVGRVWSGTTRLKHDALTKQQLAQLQSDAEFIVERL